MYIINILQKHIDAGKPHTCNSCPVALAINDILKPEYGVNVRNEEIAFFKKPEYLLIFKCSTPAFTKLFIGAFDVFHFCKSTNWQIKQFIEPFSMSLNVPKELVKEEVKFYED